MICDKCGKNMKSSSGFNMVGVSLQFYLNVPGEDEHFKKQFGKYNHKNVWNFCYECWIDSLMR